MGKVVMVKRDGITKCMRQCPALLSIVTGALISIFCDRGSRVTGAVMAISPHRASPAPVVSKNTVGDQPKRCRRNLIE